MTKDRVEIEIDVDAKDARAELRRVSAAMRKMKRATDTASQSTSRITKAQKRAGMAYGKTINEVTELGMGFSTLDPKLRGVGVQFASAGNAAYQMGTAMGPVGAGIGLVVGALPGLIHLLKDQDEAQKDVADSAHEAAEGLRDQVQAFKELQEAMGQARRLQSGAGALTLEEAQTQLREINEAERENRRELAAVEEDLRRRAQLSELGETAGEFSGMSVRELSQRRVDLQQLIEQRGELRDRRRRELRARIEELESKTAAEETQEKRRLLDEAQEDGGGRSRRRRRGEDDAALTFEDQADFDNYLQNAFARQRELHGGDEIVFADAATALSPFAQSAQDVANIAEKAGDAADGMGGMTDQTRQVQDAIEGAAEAQERLNQRMEDAADIGREAGEVLIMAFEEGPLRALDTFLETTAKRNTILALEEVARAAASYPDFVGIEQHLQAAALHAAVAAAAGGGAAAIDSGSAQPSSRPSPADAGGFGAGEGGGATTIQVNINDPVDAATAGLVQQRHERAARRAYAGRV